MRLSFQLDHAMVRRLKALDLEVTRASDLIESMDRETSRVVRRQARVGIIGATTRIENAVLTDAEIDWIDTELSKDDRPTAFTSMRPRIQAKLSRDRERSIEEVAGCREMLDIVYSQGPDHLPLTQTAVRGLHQRLLRYHPPAVHFLGRYKTVSNSVVERDLVTGEQRTVLSTSDPGVVTETAMERLLEWYNATLPVHPWPVAVGCELVFRFLACHPFQDGNGRIGRALFLLALLQCDDPGLNRVARHVAIDRVIEQNRSMYYSVLAQVSGGRFRSDPREYGIEIFLGFMLQMMHRALEDVAFYRDRVETMRGLSQSAQDLLRCFRDMPEKRLSPSVLRANTDLPARTVSRLLGTLVSKGIIQRLGRGPATRYQLIF